MHELSLAQNILEMVDKTAQENNAKDVQEIELEIGDLSGVMREALEFAFSSLRQGSIIEHTKIVMHELEAQAKCEDCSHIYFTKDHYTPCPQCGSIRSDIIAGKDLKIKSIVVNKF